MTIGDYFAKALVALVAVIALAGVQWFRRASWRARMWAALLWAAAMVIMLAVVQW